jgi:hypothetical protein
MPIVGDAIELVAAVLCGMTVSNGIVNESLLSPLPEPNRGRDVEA